MSKKSPEENPKREDFEDSHKTDISIGTLFKEILPKNPYTEKQTAVMIAGFMMIYLCWVWVPAVLFLGLMIAIWNLGQLCLKSIYRGIAWVGRMGEDE